MDPVARAVLLMIAGMLLIPVGDAFAKLITAEHPYSGAALAFARFLVGVAVVAPITLATVAIPWTQRRFWIGQTLRGALLAGVIALIIQGARTAPLADVFGAFFIGPAIATLLARAVLREDVAPSDWAAVAFGFLGVLLVVRPGGEMDPGLLWALGAGLCYGGFLTATRAYADCGPPLAQLFGQTLVGAVLLAPLALPEFSLDALAAPDFPTAWFLGSGLSSALANLLAILAFRDARAALLTPLVYSQLLSAAALSWAVFGDAPDALSALGLAIIALAGFGRLIRPARRRPAAGG